jgi:hypothetical protein
LWFLFGYIIWTMSFLSEIKVGCWDVSFTWSNILYANFLRLSLKVNLKWGDIENMLASPDLVD